jgi:CRP/FNR family transcriptional regulator, cyclic AMP receptor protein
MAPSLLRTTNKTTADAEKPSKPRSILETLSLIPLFHGLSEENLTQLAEASYIQSYKKREYICRADHPLSILFFLLEGIVQMGLTNSDGKEIGILLLEPGQWFGELALLDGQFQATTIIALQPSRAVLLPRQPFLDLLHSHPTLALDMLTIAHRRLYHVLSQVKRVQFGTPFQRVARVLLVLAQDQGASHPSGIRIRIRLTHQNLADLTGLTRETVTQTISAFRHTDCLVVDEDRQWILTDMRRIEKEAN